jgi:hypothetical protein
VRRINTIALVAAIALAVGGAAQAKPVPHGSNCYNPWRVNYARGKVTGDVAKIALVVKITGPRISVSWSVRPGYRFCSLTLVEGRGEIFRSTNPRASYTYNDPTRNHANGIRTLTASARNAG